MWDPEKYFEGILFYLDYQDNSEGSPILIGPRRDSAFLMLDPQNIADNTSVTLRNSKGGGIVHTAGNSRVIDQIA